VVYQASTFLHKTHITGLNRSLFKTLFQLHLIPISIAVSCGKPIAVYHGENFSIPDAESAPPAHFDC